MKETSHRQLLTAVEEFRSARLQAKLEQVKAALTGKSADLFSYEDVRERVRARETNRRELKEIPLDAIVGSAGRYKDFTRQFFPLIEEDEERWARVRRLTDDIEGLPPIEVFQLGAVYFVRDGNHRVSVARGLGATHIEAYVTQVETPVSLTPDIQPDDLIAKERYAHFLDRTGLDDSFADLDLSMSVAGNYRVLERQIEVHQHWVEETEGITISFPEAAARWYQSVYWPIIQVIRQNGIMRDFPGRTETDLYVWIDKHRHELAHRLGWSVDLAQAMRDIATIQRADSETMAKKVSKRLWETITPAVLESGPVVGEWRESWLETYSEQRLFSHILVAIDGQEPGWHALQEALNMAQLESGKIFGLHMLANPADKNSAKAVAMKDQFEKRCRQAGIPGELSFTTGPITDTICYRARWADLVVVSLSHPPGPKPVDRLGSQFAALLRRCPRPILTVSQTAASLQNLLLAYDGSPKANEALFVARYMMERWGTSLLVVTVGEEGHTGHEPTNRARHYLNEHGIAADFLSMQGEPAAIIMQAACENDSDLILMGGYGSSPLAEIVAGSMVNEVLRSSNRPVLICR